jgi:hypothetical protein
MALSLRRGRRAQERRIVCALLAPPLCGGIPEGRKEGSMKFGFGLLLVARPETGEPLRPFFFPPTASIP